jgi:hypothetical protein
MAWVKILKKLAKQFKKQLNKLTALAVTIGFKYVKSWIYRLARYGGFCSHATHDGRE